MTRAATISDDPIADSLSAIRALREEAEQQRAAADDRIEELNRAEAALEPLVAGRDEAPAAPADPPKGGRGQGSRRRKDSPQRRGSPAPNDADETAAEKARQGRQAGAEKRTDEVLAHIRANPGCSQVEIYEGLKISQNQASQATLKLARAGKIRKEKRGKGAAYFAKEAPAAPADHNGAKTVDERKILDCLKGAQGPLPPAEIAIRTGIRSDHVPSMAQRMAQREVIERVPPKREGLPPRYQPLRNGARPLEAAIEDAIA